VQGSNSNSSLSTRTAELLIIDLETQIEDCITDVDETAQRRVGPSDRPQLADCNPARILIQSHRGGFGREAFPAIQGVRPSLLMAEIGCPEVSEKDAEDVMALESGLCNGDQVDPEQRLGGARLFLPS